jgi:hypothetical protein
MFEKKELGLVKLTVLAELQSNKSIPCLKRGIGCFAAAFSNRRVSSLVPLKGEIYAELSKNISCPCGCAN